jgi:glutathione S-transferase
MALTLVIGNKNYSSWSLRPWIAMKVAGIAFAEEVISLDATDFHERVRKISAAAKVPALADDNGTAAGATAAGATAAGATAAGATAAGATHVWESLAILEYLAERYPQARLWPAEPNARAHARSIAAEMHAGFTPLRRHYPMNVRRPVKRREPTVEVVDSIRRIDTMWTDCRSRFGQGGPFLFGAFGAADAMYAPVVSRFHTYDVDVGPVARGYMEAVMALPAWAEWCAGAREEPWVLAKDEVD